MAAAPQNDTTKDTEQSSSNATANQTLRQVIEENERANAAPLINKIAPPPQTARQLVMFLKHSGVIHSGDEKFNSLVRKFENTCDLQGQFHCFKCGEKVKFYSPGEEIKLLVTDNSLADMSLAYLKAEKQCSHFEIIEFYNTLSPKSLQASLHSSYSQKTTQ